MSMSQQLAVNNNSNGALLEKIMTTSDLAGLSSIEKVTHIKHVCESLGLNPLTRPIQLIRFQGKEVMYVTKDATEQLRKTNRVSITNVDNKIVNGIYIVTAHASTPDGRTDASTGAIHIDGLKGDNLCNAMLKAETKAKRRVTLSICGLGFIDESEAESIPGAKKIDIENESTITAECISLDLDDALLEIYQAENFNSLEISFRSAYKTFSLKKDKEALKKVIFAKDARKQAIQKSMDSLEVNAETGEISNDSI